MRFSVNAGAFRDALGQARHATPATPSMIAFGGVLIVVDTAIGCVRITGSDGETTISAICPADDREAGQVLLPPRPLAAFLNTLDAKAKVVFETGVDGDVQVGTGGEPYRFRPLAATFPTPSLPAEGSKSANLARLPEALGAVRHATSKESPGVQLVSGAQGLALHATDNYRLARAVLAEGGFGEFVGLLPLPVLERVARSNPTAVSWDGRTRTVVFHCPSVTISTRLMATTFPAVDTVLSAVPDIQVTVSADEVLSALTRLAAVADQSPVTVRLSEDTMELRVTNADLGSGFEKVTLRDKVSTTVELHVRLTYLADALAGCAGGNVSLAYTGALQPLFIQAVAPVDTLQVVMPVRL